MNMAAGRHVKTAFAAVCAYEAAAIASGRAPTLSALCRRCRWVEAGLLGFLLVHLHHEISPNGDH